MTYEELNKKTNNLSLILMMLRKSNNVSESDYATLEKLIRKEWNDAIQEWKNNRR